MDPRLVELALTQFGVFSLGQADELGIGPRTIHRAARAGTLARTFPQIYRLAATAETWEGQLMGAQLWLGDVAAVSHASAAALWGFPGFHPGPVHLSTPRHKKPLPPVVVHKVAGNLGGDTTTVGPIRLTNAGRTLVDIAGNSTFDQLERCLEDALRRRLTSFRHLQWLLRDRYGKGAAGVVSLRKLLSIDSECITDSDFEVRLRQSLRRASLPAPIPQYEIFDGERFVARVDFAYPWAKVAIEADSYQFHSGRQAWEHDLRRRNVLTSLGWLVIHVTHAQLHTDMMEVVNRVKDALMPSLEARK